MPRKDGAVGSAAWTETDTWRHFVQTDDCPGRLLLAAQVVLLFLCLTY